ncbi:MAG: pilus assembly protein PilP [Hydrogenophaga sp.]|uniref:pilus assembly protein PilP n=1 Tax=Hydrogenophaga sp. TaxID=1904254 RepID=UPI0025BD890D|nr:pilus assembly protein PilP [Hydrogenophaga sp.]MBT9550230.1 pilus assembly protein PilP [Hydrogenophaga sp.]
MNALHSALVSVAVLSFLVGCSGSEQQELSAWMQSERNSIRPDVKPIPEPSKFLPHSYAGERFMEPFSNEKLVSILKSGQSLSTEKSALIEPELNRRKQPLEAFPLDAMSMVGILNRKGQLVALVKVDSLLYQVVAGGYLGQNYGRIVKIDENQIVLREIVQDAAGEWIERPAALQLQEETSK